MSDEPLVTHRFEKREGLSFVAERRILFRASKASEAHRFPLWRECARRHRMNCACDHRPRVVLG